MSDQGFQEVQLSGKQLVFLFMSAVVLLVVVFLLGVNVGRGARDASPGTTVSSQADSLPPPAPDEGASGGDAGKPAEPELSYHDMLLGASTPGDKATLAEPSPSVAAAAPPPVNEPLPTVQASPAQTPVTPRAGGSDWFLQIGAYSTRVVADGQVAKLRQLNVPAFVDQGGSSRLFRVRVGPYADRAKAEQVKGRIARQGFPSSITR